MSDLCLTLVFPPPIEEKLLDALLLSASERVFTSVAAAAHGLRHESMNDTERVRGRSRATHVQLVIPASEKDALIAMLRERFAGTSLRYWITPVIETGGPL